MTGHLLEREKAIQDTVDSFSQLDDLVNNLYISCDLGVNDYEWRDIGQWRDRLRVSS